MGFTIDMVTGYVSDITNGADVGKVDEAELGRSSISEPSKIDAFESVLPQERLLPVAETFTQERLPGVFSIPDSLIDRDIDSFIDEVTQ